ncbi:MAG: PadR family transcriptional regulator [Sporichthyaceae bacterium]
MPKQLTSTSYAVLGLLAERPYTGYELTRMIRIGFSQCMPRSTSGLYNEPKILVEHGFATANEEMKGRQKRTLYTITPAGRKALRAWFKTPPPPFAFESESIVRLILGRAGKREDVIAALAGLEGQVAELLERGTAEMPTWLETVGATPEHLNDLAVMARFYVDFYALIVEWSRWAREQIAERPDKWPPDAAEQAMQALRQAMFGGALLAPDDPV